MDSIKPSLAQLEVDTGNQRPTRKSATFGNPRFGLKPGQLAVYPLVTTKLGGPCRVSFAEITGEEALFGQNFAIYGYKQILSASMVAITRISCSISVDPCCYE